MKTELALQSTGFNPLSVMAVTFATPIAPNKGGWAAAARGDTAAYSLPMPIRGFGSSDCRCPSPYLPSIIHSRCRVPGRARERDAAADDRRQAAAELANAKRDAAKTLADADRLHGAQEKLFRDAEEKERQAIDAGDAARQAAARTEGARRKAETKEKEFTDKIERLKVALREV